MADETTVARITSQKWRQGSVLGPILVDEAIKRKPDRVDIHEDNFLIVTSHDCDIANESLQKEPVVEVLRASACRTSPNGNFQCGRNPRSLDLVWEMGGKEIGLRLNIHDRWVIPRELLSKEAPCLDGQQLGNAWGTRSKNSGSSLNLALSAMESRSLEPTK
jgi:hypothetical protein